MSFIQTRKQSQSFLKTLGINRSEEKNNYLVNELDFDSSPFKVIHTLFPIPTGERVVANAGEEKKENNDLQKMANSLYLQFFKYYLQYIDLTVSFSAYKVLIQSLVSDGSNRRGSNRRGSNRRGSNRRGSSTKKRGIIEEKEMLIDQLTTLDDETSVFNSFSKRPYFKKKIELEKKELDVYKKMMDYAEKEVKNIYRFLRTNKKNLSDIIQKIERLHLLGNKNGNRFTDTTSNNLIKQTGKHIVLDKDTLHKIIEEAMMYKRMVQQKMESMEKNERYRFNHTIQPSTFHKQKSNIGNRLFAMLTKNRLAAPRKHLPFLEEYLELYEKMDVAKVEIELVEYKAYQNKMKQVDLLVEYLSRF